MSIFASPVVDAFNDSPCITFPNGQVSNSRNFFVDLMQKLCSLHKFCPGQKKKLCLCLPRANSVFRRTCQEPNCFAKVFFASARGKKRKIFEQKSLFVLDNLSSLTLFYYRSNWPFPPRRGKKRQERPAFQDLRLDVECVHPLAFDTWPRPSWLTNFPFSVLSVRAGLFECVSVFSTCDLTGLEMQPRQAQGAASARRTAWTSPWSSSRSARRPRKKAFCASVRLLLTQFKRSSDICSRCSSSLILTVYFFLAILWKIVFFLVSPLSLSLQVDAWQCMNFPHKGLKCLLLFPLCRQGGFHERTRWINSVATQFEMQGQKIA